MLGALTFTGANTFAAPLTSANLEEPSAAARNSAKEAVKGAKAQLNKGQVSIVLQRGLEHLINASLNLLSEQGHGDYANRKREEWMTSFSMHSGKNFNTLDLGDHSPLSEWLVGFYNGIEARVDQKWINFFNIGDIKTFNYGIPVSAKPRGNPETGNDWGKEEYGAHFVPTSAAAIYWISSQACSLAVPLPWSLGCGFAARLPRYAMEHVIGPKISDRVYEQFN